VSDLWTGHCADGAAPAADQGANLRSRTTASGNYPGGITRCCLGARSERWAAHRHQMPARACGAAEPVARAIWRLRTQRRRPLSNSSGVMTLRVLGVDPGTAAETVGGEL